LRKLGEKVAGIHAEAPLPHFETTPLSKRLPVDHPASAAPVATDRTTGKVAIYITCYGDHNEPQVVEDMMAVLQHNGISVKLLADAKILDQAGADFIVLECIPSTLAQSITENTGFSTIGIGAGATTDAQVLVSYDLLGLSPHPAKFVKDFLADAAQNSGQTASVVGAFKAYNDAVKSGQYPGSEHEYQ